VIPNDPALRNNFAPISLLLKAEKSHACAIAQDLHKARIRTTPPSPQPTLSRFFNPVM
jgi:hypothetical protein